MCQLAAKAAQQDVARRAQDEPMKSATELRSGVSQAGFISAENKDAYA
ncbi:hypothetical protein AGMMS49941_12220 [Deferribacterales bacterium]|nr:hypothetical protein AGMMS49941_12220 [Deferribacterales bacterium]